VSILELWGPSHGTGKDTAPGVLEGANNTIGELIGRHERVEIACWLNLVIPTSQLSNLLARSRLVTEEVQQLAVHLVRVRPGDEMGRALHKVTTRSSD
jgi:hypothetical protein